MENYKNFIERSKEINRDNVIYKALLEIAVNDVGETECCCIEIDEDWSYCPLCGFSVDSPPTHEYIEFPITEPSDDAIRNAFLLKYDSFIEYKLIKINVYTYENEIKTYV